jgi:hypothetical protein
MRKFIISIVILSTFILISAFSTKVNEDLKMNSAEVESVQGLYVFYKSKPSKEYTYLGTVKTPFIIKNYKGSYLLELMTKRAKEQYPSCNAVIFKNDDLLEVDAVTIK